MFGFLFKILLIAGLTAGVAGYVMYKKSSGGEFSLPKIADISSPSAVLGVFKNVDTQNLSKQVSQVLDSLVTNSNSPVVLGVKVSNDTINTVTDAILKLPNTQLEQVREILCATPSNNLKN